MRKPKDEFKRLEDMQREWKEKERHRGQRHRGITLEQAGIAVGYNAGYGLNTGDWNVFIGEKPLSEREGEGG